MARTKKLRWLWVFFLCTLAGSCAPTEPSPEADQATESKITNATEEERLSPSTQLELDGALPAEAVADKPELKPRQGLQAEPEIEDVFEVAEPSPLIRDNIQFEEIQPGLSVFRGLRGREEPTEVLAVRVDPRHFRVRVEESVSGKKQPGLTLHGYQQDHSSVAVLSGGFLKSFYPVLPLGLVKSDGRVSNRERGSDLLSGLFSVRGRRLMIGRFSRDAIDEAEDALQSGPLLILDGQLAASALQLAQSSEPSLTDGSSERAVIAIDDEGFVLLIRTGKTSLWAIADHLLHSSINGRVGISAALNLSGAESSGLIIKTPVRSDSFGSTKARLPNAIVIQTR